ncbi:MAG: reverse transcriptase domain-containing protein [Armatimonadetes bacterium]|nr:reverse transcriptase domain-containing protein [Armatimonadota bacterium]
MYTSACRTTARPSLEGIAQGRSLATAWGRVAERRRCPGVDGQTVGGFARNAEANLEAIGIALRTGTYEPLPAKRVTFLEPDGKARTIGLVSVRDRVVQAAMCAALRPTVEVGNPQVNHAYRPGHCSTTALDALSRAIAAGRPWIMRTDVRGFFDSIPHDLMRETVARVTDDAALVDAVMRQVEAQSPGPARGLCQGAPVSNLLSNLYLKGFDRGAQLRYPGVVRFCDDMAVACRTQEEAYDALAAFARALDKLGLAVNEAKTAVTPASEGFTYLKTRFGADGRPAPILGLTPAGDSPAVQEALSGRYGAPVQQLVGGCAVVGAIADAAASGAKPSGEHKSILLYAAGRLGSAGAAFATRALAAAPGHDAAKFRGRLAGLKTDVPPVRCAKVRSWLAQRGEQAVCTGCNGCHTPLAHVQA